MQDMTWTMRKPISGLPDHRPYTLIELLVVMAIAVAVMGLAIGFGGKLRGSSLDNASRNCLTSLHLARQYAITQRAYVAVLLPDPTTALTPAEVRGDYQARSWRPCIVNSNGVFQRYVDGTAWEFLPRGVAFNASGLDAITTVNVNAIAGTAVSPITISGVVFTPRGDLMGNSSKTISIGVGGVSSGSVLLDAAAIQTITIRGLTGKARLN